MPQFDPTTFASQVFWLAITFIALYVLMARVALPRIAEVLEERSERIADDLERAESLKKEADAVVEQYEAALAKARAEAGALIARAAQEIAETSARRQAEFAAELARKTEAAEARITRAKDEAKSHVRDIAIEVAGDISAKLIGVAPNQDQVAKSVDAQLKGAA
jgi:F-type H+-transporting ATPase subunit b